MNLFLFLSSVEPNIRIHLLEHITMSAVERGLRDHSKPFHYEGFLLGNEGIFLFLILFSSLADVLSDLAMAGSWRVCSFNQNCHCWILQLGLAWAPLKTSACYWNKMVQTAWAEEVGSDCSLPVAIGCLFSP